ncbi:glycosyltransferase family 25 protein [Campylobacter sp. FMV-PI01]|uniref:Glycosyltransferase family 25 protein n=1 Tax=Campylobacter portucalensis TaxID=2608384 RepID=A0A6L5WK95_9BACT|nr:glycosyltransferase family 25 protein [Campylobacter portucalensis]MSN96842.1 glycosyltransferase family 25 protein [Campylobacter portucalensis]
MKIFVINLEKDTHKKEIFIKNFSKFNLEYEFIKGVHGKELNKDELNKKVYDYKNCFMTDGEIGCALSHLKIYEKMQDEDISHALILEDDAIFSDEFLEYFNKFDEFLKDKKEFDMVCFMHQNDEYFKNLTIKIDDFKIYKIAKGVGCYGYVITKNSAKKLLKINTPLILEADCWVQFIKMCDLQVYCLDKNIIKTSDFNGLNSSIGDERHKMGKQKSRARKSRLRKMGGGRYMIGSLKYRFYYKIYSKFLVSGDKHK